MMVESLCQAYHWPLEKAMNLTLPQMIMLNHASWVNHENSERRFKAKRKWEESTNRLESQQQDALDKMSPQELSAYLSAPFM